MATTRKAESIFEAVPAVEGAGVHLQRLFGFGKEKIFDPFLLLDDFRSGEPDLFLCGFPWHPHRGIETVTYMIEGELDHGDSLGNAGVIGPGDVQWMTAGSGIIHQEMPRGNKEGRIGGFQLWTNLPALEKTKPPKYREVKSGTIPKILLEGGGEIRVIAGEAGGVRGPIDDIVVDPLYLDVTLPAGTAFTQPVIPGYTAFAYLFEGSLAAGGLTVGAGKVLLFEPSGDELAFTSGSEKARFLLLAGKPLREPIVWYGSIVMNTREEIERALDEYRTGKFVKT